MIPWNEFFEYLIGGFQLLILIVVTVTVLWAVGWVMEKLDG